jgi:uncharacterized protein
MTARQMHQTPNRKCRPVSIAGSGWLFALVLPALALVLASLAPAFAQSPPSNFRSRSYITPFPQTDRYYLHVIGDYLASGLAAGLDEALAQEGTVKIINSTKSSAGLARPDRTDWAADIDELAKQPIHIAVIMMGVNDVRNINKPDGVVRWGTDEWRDAYGAEIDKLLKALKAKSVAVYWVGLPVMANSKTSEAMALMNDIARERTYVNGVKFIDTWSGFTDQLGGFTAYGPDITGQSKRLREPDGVGFTDRGNRKLANYVEVVLRRDLAAARGERNIPLAGDEDEQSRLVPKAPEAGASTDGKPAPGSTAGGPVPPGGDTPKPAPGSSGPTAVEKAVASAQTAQQDAAQQGAIAAFASGYSPPGETILGDINEGLTGLATVSPVTDLNANIGERRLPVTERLYYKTLVKGEALKPKPGRADDFKWPRG